MAAPAAGLQPPAVGAPATTATTAGVLPALSDRRHSSVSTHPVQSVSKPAKAKLALPPASEVQQPPWRKTHPTDTPSSRPNGPGTSKPPMSLAKDMAAGRAAANGLPTRPVSANSTPAVEAAKPATVPSTEPTTRLFSVVSLTGGRAPIRNDEGMTELRRTVYKMKRSKQPGGIPTSPGSHLHSVYGPGGTKDRAASTAPSTPVNTTPTTTPPPTIKTQPPQKQQPTQTQTEPHANPTNPTKPSEPHNSPKPAFIESDILPSTTKPPSSATAGISPGPQNGVKRWSELAADPAEPAHKKTKTGTPVNRVDQLRVKPLRITPMTASGLVDESSDNDDSEDVTEDDNDTEDADEDDEEAENEGNKKSIEVDSDDGEAADSSGVLDIDDEPQDEDASLAVLGSRKRKRTALEPSPPHFKLAPSGRPYNQYIDKKGVSHSSKGAIIPDGYRRWNDSAAPWICPVRSCRLLFALLPSLGRHFSRGHRAVSLNDNLDGTLSIISRGSSKTANSLPMGARVVSQKKLATPGRLAEPRMKKGVFLLRTSMDASGIPSGTMTDVVLRSQPTTTMTTTTTPKAPKAGKELLVSASGRKYAESLEGGLAFGILFPDGYKKSSYPGMPWLCPVRDCQRVSPAINSLGAHFTTKHKFSKFNDNCDGTLSKVGAHSNIRPIVVSQIVRPASEMEPLAKEFPMGYRPKEPAPAPALAETTPGASAPTPSSELTHRNSMWGYIKAFVTPAMARLGQPKTGKAALYFHAPRVRDVHWNEKLARPDPNAERYSTHLAGILIQVTGDYADKPCDHCRSGSGPFVGCVLPSKSGTPDMNVAYTACANCLHGHGRVTCSLSKTARQRFQQRFPTLDYASASEALKSKLYRRDLINGGNGTNGTTHVNGVSHEIRPTNKADKAELLPAACSAVQVTSDNEPLIRRSEKRQRGVPDPLSGGQVPEPYQDKFGRRRSGRIAEFGETIPSAESNMALARVQKLRNSSNSPLLFAGNAQVGADALEMEDWEVAPGRVQSAANDNVAFSNAYLTSSQMVPINHNMSYRVEVVRPGATVAFEADGRATRTCTLASGKLRVTVGDADFVMGPHGMFLVTPGKVFSVQNRLYIDAYLHITALL